jgi:hypothetical protein
MTCIYRSHEFKTIKEGPFFSFFFFRSFFQVLAESRSVGYTIPIIQTQVKKEKKKEGWGK